MNDLKCSSTETLTDAQVRVVLTLDTVDVSQDGTLETRLQSSLAQDGALRNDILKDLNYVDSQLVHYCVVTVDYTKVRVILVLQPSNAQRQTLLEEGATTALSTESLLPVLRRDVSRLIMDTDVQLQTGDWQFGSVVMDTDLTSQVGEWGAAQADVNRACAHLKGNHHRVAASVLEQVNMDETLTPFIGQTTITVPSVVCAGSPLSYVDM